MKFFKPEDFYPEEKCVESKLEYETAAYRANAKLEREGRIMELTEHFSMGLVTGNPTIYQSHKRVLVIEIPPIEKCKHEENKVDYIKPFGMISGFYKCRCGIKVKPTAFEEIK